MRLALARALSAGLLSLTFVAVLAASAGAAERDGSDYVVPGSYIVVLDDSVRSVSSETAAQERGAGFDARRLYRHAIKGYSARLSRAQVRELRRDPQVVSVEPNRILKARDTLASGELVPSGIARMGAAQSGSPGSARAASAAGVAVIDTGVDLDHPDLNAVSGYNCITPGASAEDDDGHGTHVAGTIAAKNSGAGVVGVAPGTTIHAVKVLDANGSGTWEQVICGIDWVTANAGARGIEVANMSLGGLGSSADNAACGTSTTALHNAICNSTSGGVRYAVAAGNDAWAFPHSTLPDVPASYDEAITVTAYGDSDGRSGGAAAAPSCRSGEADDRYASFSNWSNTSADNGHTLSAPGVCVNSTAPGGGYAVMSGTSMATPHVAGATALCVSERAGDGSAVPGACDTLTTPATVIPRLVSTTSAHGYTGDPFRPLSGRYYGYTAVAGTPLAAPNFSLSSSPTSRSITRGQRTTYAIAISRQNGFTTPVTLSATGLPNRATASFSPQVVSGSSSTMTLSTATNTPRGTYSVTVRGTGSGLARTVKVTLTVR